MSSTLLEKIHFVDRRDSEKEQRGRPTITNTTTTTTVNNH